MTGGRLRPRLVLICGLPASGKTTLAREIADAYGAVRLNPDEWETALDVDPFDEGFQARLEAQFWKLTQRKVSPKPSIFFSNNPSSASGVTSRPVTPVPPVEITASMLGSSIHFETWARILSTSSVTMARSER